MIEEFIETRTAERIDLDFKREVYPRTQKGRKEVIKDISAMANTRGGLIVIGVAERNNCADQIRPLSESDSEQEKAWIEQMVHSGIEPRMYGVVVEKVQVDGGFVVCVSVPRSSSRPHRVATENSNRFWLRNAQGAFEPSVEELRRIVLQSAESFERGNHLHDERCSSALEGVTVQNLANIETALVIHIVPVDAFSQPLLVEPKAVVPVNSSFEPIRQLIGSSSFRWRFSYDGVVVYRGSPTCVAYTLVRRDGVVEAVKIGVHNLNNQLIYPFRLESEIVYAVSRYVSALLSLDVVPPFYIFTTIIGVGGRALGIRLHEDFDDGQEEIVPKDLVLPAGILESESSSEVDIGEVLRPTFDAIWNAGGYDGSQSYSSGKWERRPELTPGGA